MKFGTMSILFREQLGTDEHIGYVESIKRISAAGFENADLNLCQICAHKTELHKDSWKQYADKIIQTAQETGISFPQCHLPFKSQKVKWQTAEDYEYYMQMMYRAIDVASYIGIPWGVVHPDSARNPELTFEQKLEAVHKEYTPVIEYAIKKGLGIAFENAGAFKEIGFCSLAEHLVELVDHYNDSMVGICWDTGHANPAYEDQGEAFRILGNRLHCTHIADNNKKADLHLLPFRGTVDWTKVMAGLRAINYSGALILEPMINLRTPNELKDAAARFAFESAKLLSEM